VTDGSRASRGPSSEPTGHPTRSRVLLAAAAVLLAGVVGTEVWYLAGSDDVEPSAERPVVTGTVVQRSAVESAARSTQEILSYGFEDFDAQVDDATTKMTEPFAEEFRQTAAGDKGRFVKQRITQEVRVVTSAVVTASEEEVQALLFLDQYVARAGEGTSVTLYRALVTVRRSDGGWLVSDIETE